MRVQGRAADVPRLLVAARRSTDESIKVFGDGEQLRDLNYVDDAVEAFLLAATRDEANGEVYNLGGDAVEPRASSRELLVELDGGRRVAARSRSRPTARRSTSATTTPTSPGSSGARLAADASISQDGLAAHLALLPRARRGTTGTEALSVPFLDLRAPTPHGSATSSDAAMRGSSTAAGYVFGEEVERFEEAFAAYCGARFAVGVASGTDAITIALRAAGVGPGDEVITAANTCVPTIVGIERGRRDARARGRRRRDVHARPRQVERGDHAADARDPAVHLYGQCADLDAAAGRWRASHGLRVVEDCAQAHGAAYGGRRAARSATPPRSASTRRRTWAHSATAARS